MSTALTTPVRVEPDERPTYLDRRPKLKTLSPSEQRRRYCRALVREWKRLRKQGVKPE